VITCSRCQKTADAPPPHRVPFTGAAKERILTGICAACWKEWEVMEVKVINEYRLNFMDPQHRAQMQKSCFEFFNFPLEA
jgi:Fe-S cluster biosynthesis and repair protein YggX